MKSILVQVLIGATFVVNSATGKKSDDIICNAAGADGYICKSCTLLGMCTCDSNCQATKLGWVIDDYMSCPAGKVCNKGKCITGTTCTPENSPDFICSSVGVFPDPYDCTKYHFCAPDRGAIVHYPAECEADGPQLYGYNPVTARCNIKLWRNRCNNLPIPVCKRPFDTGTVGGNSALYYVCLNIREDGNLTDVLYPHQYTCPYATTYYSNRGECR